MSALPASALFHLLPMYTSSPAESKGSLTISSWVPAPFLFSHARVPIHMHSIHKCVYWYPFTPCLPPSLPGAHYCAYWPSCALQCILVWPSACLGCTTVHTGPQPALRAAEHTGLRVYGCSTHTHRHVGTSSAWCIGI